ncbi:unnamed protein product [Rhizophagus irregularis]|nr:unnamed protein product [Rhizophagus irregularis]
MVCGSSANFPAKIFKESKMSIITLNCLLLPYEVADRSKLSEGNSPPEEHIHIIVKLPLLSLEEALSCIPPPITYSPDCVTSKTTTKAIDILYIS